MKKLIKIAIDLGLALILIAIKPLDTYSYLIGMLTVLIWDTSELIFRKYFKG